MTASFPVLPVGCWTLASAVGDTICLGFPDVKCLARIHKIHRLPGRGCCCEKQAGATCVGSVFSLAWVCRNCGCNMVNALVKRHGVPQHPVLRDFEQFLAGFEQHRLGIERLFRDSPYQDFEVWLAKWPLWKRQAIQKSILEEDVLPKRGRCMVKRESNHKPPTKARLIQFYVNLATQAKFAHIFTALQKAFTDSFKRIRFPGGIRITIASGMNSVDLGDWMSEVLAETKDPWFYERDGKNWDASMQREHHDLKSVLFDMAGEDFLKFLDDCFRVRTKGQSQTGPFTYTIHGTVKSGQNDTSSGNGLVNVAIAYCAMRVLGLIGDILAAGDDIVIVVSGDFDADALARVEREYGITPEYRKFRSVSQVSFISGVWVPRAPGKYSFAPSIGRLLARLWWTCKPPSHRNFADYIHSVVSGLLPTCGGIPLLGPWLRSCDCPGRLVQVDKGHIFLTGVQVDYHEDPLHVWFVERYGMGWDQVMEAQHFLVELRNRPGFVRHYLIDKILAVDLADLLDR